jgi:hypothetical protein
VRVAAPTGDSSVLPPGRRYLIRLKLARPAAVGIEGRGDLPPAGADAGHPGWWMEDGFLCVRPPGAPAITVVVTHG